MGIFPTNVFSRICHVKHGYQDRERHILSEFRRRGVPVNWYLDWDIADISEAQRHLFSACGVNPAEVSLSMKHVGIWREFLATDLPFCLVFEDDVFLARDFVARLRQCLDELGDPKRSAVVYLGNAGNYYTPRTSLVNGRSLYPAPHSRCTDSYLLTRSAADARCRWFMKNKLERPLDHQVNVIDAHANIDVLWFERPIVEQGSANGAFPTSITPSRQRPRWYARMEWNWKKFCRLYFGHSIRR